MLWNRKKQSSWITRYLLRLCLWLTILNHTPVAAQSENDASAGGTPIEAQPMVVQESQLQENQLQETTALQPNVEALQPNAPDATPTPQPPAPPELLSPDDGTLTNGENYPPLGVPTLRWSPASGALIYIIQISKAAGFATTVVKADTYATSFTPLEALPDNEYYWRVSACSNTAKTNCSDFSDYRTFVKSWSNQGAIMPTLLSPEEDSTRAVFANNDFSWTPVPGAAAYLLEIASDPTFSSIEYKAITIKPQHTPTTRLTNNNNIYYWRVTPIDNQDQLGTASATSRFTFSWNLSPRLIAPENFQSDNSNVGVLRFVPRFQWTAVEAANQYVLEVSTQPDMSNPLLVIKTPNTDYTPVKNLANDQDYYWRVRAIDYKATNGPYSETRRFRMKWNFTTSSLTPRNNQIKQTHPFFTFSPIPGAERYQVQTDESTSFDFPMLDTEFYNVNTASLYKLKDTAFYFGTDYFWRVRGIDAQNNYTPWSQTYSYQFGRYETSPNPIYPFYYYQPDAGNMPEYRDHTAAWPVFLWDSADACLTDNCAALQPDYYELTVATDPGFQDIRFQIETAGYAAAPTLEDPFKDLVDGQTYYWRVRAILPNGRQLGVDSIWFARFDRNVGRINHSNLPLSNIVTPIYPADGFQSVAAAPLLGWQPLNGADHYRVQVSRDPDFTQIVEDVHPQFVNYSPWQGKREEIPPGSYWWRVRGETPSGSSVGDWSPSRRFDLSFDLITGNPYDLYPPPSPHTINETYNHTQVITRTDATGKEYTDTIEITYDPIMSHVVPEEGVDEGQYDVHDLYVMLNRVNLVKPYPNGTLIRPGWRSNSWIFTFGVQPKIQSTVEYEIYIDVNHRQGVGATTDPLGKQITVDPLYYPEYVVYVTRNLTGIPNNTGNIIDAKLYRWSGSAWLPAQTLSQIDGDLWLSPKFDYMQVIVPYTALDGADESFAGSLAVTVLSSAPDTQTMIDSVPRQEDQIEKPTFVSDMLLPLYPFDTPLTNPMEHFDMPPMRWRLPYFDSADGYEVQVARDAKFTDLVETWDSSEARTFSDYYFIPTILQPAKAYADNESYYWRVRIIHERYDVKLTLFDTGPWSPAMRFKLNSRKPKNLNVSTGDPAGTTPTFTWDRVDGASGYTIQIDDDANFTTPDINQAVDGTSFTPAKGLADGAYFWRVTTRRSKTILGEWSPVLSFVKRSLTPQLLTPIDSVVINEQPTFSWTPVLSPADTPRIAAARYQLEVSSDESFSAPKVFRTESTSFTPKWKESIGEGNLFWRVAVIDTENRVGAYSPVQRFYREYLPPTLTAPVQGATWSGAPQQFEWSPMNGAAYYEIQIDDDPNFASSIRGKTDATCYTPIDRMQPSDYYWRVRMFDNDDKPGPFQLGKVSVGYKTFLPTVMK